MRIAVTGATGFLGRYIASHLAGQGHQCRCWYRPSSDRSGLPEGIDWRKGELGDDAASRELVSGCDAVIHAGLDHPKGWFNVQTENLLDFIEKNVLGTLRLIHSARGAGVGRFVFISSCAVHDVILPDRPLDESHPTWAKSHYGAHKAAIEQFVYSFGLGEGYPICSLRPTGIYGLAYPARDSKWYELIAAVVRGEDVDCRRGGKEVHAIDVARAAEILLTADGIAGQAYNCCDRYISDHEVATIAQKLSEGQGRIAGSATTPKNQIDTRKLQGLGMRFGGRPLLEQTVRQIVSTLNSN